MDHQEPPSVTRSMLIEDLKALGVRPGQVVMLHASVKAVGWVVGGPDVILHALREVLGPDGTLMMYVGWEDGTYEMDSWPEAKRRAYLEDCPPFDPATSRAVIGWSILTEYLRTTPGARRSENPEASMAAIGAKAGWLTADHPSIMGSGRGRRWRSSARRGAISCSSARRRMRSRCSTTPRPLPTCPASGRSVTGSP
jgi:aminoglycoside 3-N-acetyltransferase